MLTMTDTLLENVESIAKENCLPMASTCLMLISQSVNHIKEEKEFKKSLPQMFKTVMENPKMIEVLQESEAQNKPLKTQNNKKVITVKPD